MTGSPRPCKPHLEVVAFDYRLPHLTEALKHQRKIKIVAIGSSSTAGTNGIVPFTHRLELALRSRFYGHMIDVLNRGVGGQEAPEELARFECDVFAETPSLVIWQVGTNAVYRKIDYNFDDVERAIAVGLSWLATLPADVVLMDLQLTTAIVVRNVPPGPGQKPLADDIEDRISAVAASAQVNLFKRWALMNAWRDKDGVLLPEMDDGVDPFLHTGEWATQCIANAFDLAIAAAVGPLAGAPSPPTV